MATAFRGWAAEGVARQVRSFSDYAQRGYGPLPRITIADCSSRPRPLKTLGSNPRFCYNMNCADARPDVRVSRRAADAMQKLQNKAI